MSVGPLSDRKPTKLPGRSCRVESLWEPWYTHTHKATSPRYRHCFPRNALNANAVSPKLSISGAIKDPVSNGLPFLPHTGGISYESPLTCLPQTLARSHTVVICVRNGSRDGRSTSLPVSLAIVNFSDLVMSSYGISKATLH